MEISDTCKKCSRSCKSPKGLPKFDEQKSILKAVKNLEEKVDKQILNNLIREHLK